ncbi:MAG: hypothetical protein KAZ71_06865 [Bacteroidia bacterium]|nr:hypothetical protein [Bacteroidia bacterium]
MKLADIFKKKTAKAEAVVVKVDKKLLAKIVGGAETASDPSAESVAGNPRPKVAKESHGKF